MTAWIVGSTAFVIAFFSMRCAVKIGQNKQRKLTLWQTIKNPVKPRYKLPVDFAAGERQKIILNTDLSRWN